MAIQKSFRVTLRFTTKMGVNVERTIDLRDVSRANAEYRAKRVAVPAGATNVVVA